MKRALVLAVLCTAITVPALSGKKDKGADAAADTAALQATVDYRHTLYESMGKHMKMASFIVKGQLDVPDDMLLHAQALHGASKSIPKLFPAGTGPDNFEKTEALPSIWEDPEGFEQAVAAYQTETAKLVEVAKAGDVAGFKAQFGKVGATCGGCHDKFRKDDD